MFCSDSLSAGINAIAIALANDRPEETVELLATVFTQLSDNLLNILTLRRRAKAHCDQFNHNHGKFSHGNPNIDLSNLDDSTLQQIIELNNLKLREEELEK